METKEQLLQVLPLRGMMIFPSMISHIDVGRKKSIEAIEKAMLEEQIIFLTSQKEIAVELPSNDDIYEVGTVAKINQMIKLPNNSYRIIIEGLYRAEITENSFAKDGTATVIEHDSIREDEIEEEALMRQLLSQFKHYVKSSKKITKEAFESLLDIEDANHLAFMVTSHLPIKLTVKQHLFEMNETNERLKALLTVISNEKKVFNLERKIGRRVRSEMDKAQKEYYLKEQLKAIKEELEESNGELSEVEKLKEDILLKEMPEKITEVALTELERYERIPQNSAESSVIRNYLNWLIDLPWHEKTEDKIEIDNALKILNEDHYGLSEVKERILEYLAVQKLTNSIKGPILCLVGPPGVGKTSLAKSIASSINRKFVRISLGGVRDEAEIRGHRRTYIGAMPGRIIQGMKKAETVNPVFLLDELDKMANDFRGDPSSAMLEVLDPEQNSHFSDHFIAETYDLSNVLFVATANYINNIPEPLLDRMEVISIAGYTEVEKLHIAKEHLAPKQIHENGLTKGQIQFRETALMKIIREYTREAGVRSLERTIAKVCRKAAKIIISNEKKRVVVTGKNVEEFLGKPIFRYGQMEEENQIGAATGLAYTTVGGDTLSIEVTHYPGKGELILTGKLGEVMRESAQAASSYIRSRAEELGIDPKFYEKSDIHIHVPEGATPKDGPSAGITMATAIISALSNKAVKKEVAMTGEITLRGRVLPIGGLKEKSLSAHRAGITQIIIPYDNIRDIEDIPESVRKDLEFIPVKHLDEVLKYALVEA